jgi:polyisoprenoid-binding protein YceI
MLHRYRWLLIGLGVVILLPVVGTFLYLNVLRDDPPERLSLDDVPAQADGTTTTAGDSSADLAGPWSVGDGSVVGYRVSEQLFGQSAEAVGRSESVAGSLTIDGTTVTDATFEVDMATFESGESQRDGQFRNRIMEVDEFPTATFVLTEPIELGSLPADGEVVTASATGDLTLHGVTREVAIDLTSELTGATFAVSGSTTITFTDYGIDDPSGGPASVGEEGELEVLLAFAR